MTDDILALLKNRNPAIRKQGIQQIARRGDTTMLPYLAQIVKKDPDESVRQLARQVGQQLKNAPKPKAAATTKQTASTATSQKDSVAEKQAKELLDKALHLRIENDKESAKELAREAFQMYPALQDDPHSVEIASSIMNATPKVAIEQLLSNKTRQNKTRYKEPNYEPGIFYPIQRYLFKKDVSWRDVLIDFVALMVLGALPIGLMLLAINVVLLVNPQLIQTAGFPAEVVEDLQLARGFNAVGIWLRVMLMGIPFIALFFLFQMFLTHIASMFIMGGDGRFPGLLHRTMPTMVMMIGFLFAFVELYPLLYAIGLSSWAESGGLTWLGWAAVFFFLFRFSLNVGQNYHFGDATTAKGCVAIALPYIITFVLFGVFVMLTADGGSAPIGVRSIRFLRYLF